MQMSETMMISPYHQYHTDTSCSSDKPPSLIPSPDSIPKTPPTTIDIASKIPAIDQIFYQHYQNILYNMLITKLVPPTSIPAPAPAPVASPPSGRPQLKLPTVPAAELYQPQKPLHFPALALAPAIRYDEIDNVEAPHMERLSMAATNPSWKLRPRGRIKAHSSWSERVRCRLCQNQIMTNRLANLQNHSRRHSKLKQFRCPYCPYAHTEVAKVRLHIDHNHSENVSLKKEPLDLRDEKMEESWAIMMRVCFPGYSD